ncbi:MAG: SdiA-regulated domain-containing protein [Candidatus Binatia bacterium]
MAYNARLDRIVEYHADTCKLAPGRVAVKRASLLQVALVLVAAPLLIALRFGDSTSDVVEWPIPEFAEPSGVVYHPLRDSLFLVGDEGDIGEVSLEGKLLRQFRLGGDLEAIAVDPKSGLLFVVREGHEVIFEVRPDNFKIVRRFTVDRSYNGDPNFLRRGGDGIEGLTFVPDDHHPEGGKLWAVNQFDPPVLIELGIALKTSKEKYQVARIARAIPVDGAPLSEVTWDPGSRKFLVLSALWKRAVVLDVDGKLERSVRVPAFMAEGLTRLPDGRVVIAQDSGGLVAWNPRGDPFAGEAAAGPPDPGPGNGSAAPVSTVPAAGATKRDPAKTEPRRGP